MLCVLFMQQEDLEGFEQAQMNSSLQSMSLFLLFVLNTRSKESAYLWTSHSFVHSLSFVMAERRMECSLLFSSSSTSLCRLLVVLFSTTHSIETSINTHALRTWTDAYAMSNSKYKQALRRHGNGGDLSKFHKCVQVSEYRCFRWQHWGLLCSVLFCFFYWEEYKYIINIYIYIYTNIYITY